MQFILAKFGRSRMSYPSSILAMVCVTFSKRLAAIIFCSLQFRENNKIKGFTALGGLLAVVRSPFIGGDEIKIRFFSLDSKRGDLARILKPTHQINLLFFKAKLLITHLQKAQGSSLRDDLPQELEEID